MSHVMFVIQGSREKRLVKTGNAGISPIDFARLDDHQIARYCNVRLVSLDTLSAVETHCDHTQ